MFVNLITIYRRFFYRLARTQLGLVLVPIVLLIVIGTIGYAMLEGWSLFEALYVTIITITTIGYGDFSPETVGGRWFAIFFAMSAIGLASYAVSTLAAKVIEWEQNRVQRQVQEKRMRTIESLKDHVIICGASNIGRVAGLYFQRAKQDIIIVEADEDRLRRALLYLDVEYLRKKFSPYHDIANAVDVTEDEQLSLDKLAEKIDVPYLMVEPTEDSTLIAAGIGRAKGVVAALDSDERNLFTVVSARALSQRLDNVKLRIIALVHDDKNGTKLQVAGADQLVLPEKGSGLQIQTFMMNARLADFSLRTTIKGTAGYALQQLSDDPAASWQNDTIAELSAARDLVVLAVWRDGDYIYSPPHDTRLQTHDELIVFAPSQDLDLFSQFAKKNGKG
ncbi:MAG: potassium channel protein [Ardenticatenaceae bacterium]|nr:potassium channel protein [Ardenticatenaceae bacterium]